MYPLFRSKTTLFLNFKSDLDIANEKQLHKYYQLLEDVHIKRNTDLNEKCIQYILNHITGDNILDIACGTGYLAKQIALSNKNKKVIGVDFSLNKHSNLVIDNLTLQYGTLLDMDFDDDFFDTVICAHTLEHLYNPIEAIGELRRVAKKRLIIVLPKQREYKYTFDLHLHFFPYKYTLYSRLGISRDALVIVLDNDYLIVEDF